jgi:hypothetical protein
VAGSCGRGKERSGYVKGGGYLKYLRNYQLLKGDYSLWS